MDVFLVDLDAWRSGDPGERRRVTGGLDASLRDTGFVLVTGHRVEPALREAVRAAARAFFDLPPEVKDRYRKARGWGWTALRAVAVGSIARPGSPPDLVELWTAKAHHPEVWPREVPALRAPVEAYVREMRRLSLEMLELLAAALGKPADFLTRHDAGAAWTCNVNRYGSRRQVGAPRPGQYRLGAHRDWDLLAVLDRQPGLGGLQIRHGPADAADPEAGWRDAPYEPGADALTVNVGELGAMWSGERWRAGWHRVLPPPEAAPTEELTSLVYFYNPAPDAPLPPSAAREQAGTVGEFLRRRLEAISLT